MTPRAHGYLGVDGGGTKTSAVIVDSEGHEIARAQGPTSNPSIIGLDAASQVIRDVIEEAKTQAGPRIEIERAWAGLSGFGRQSDHETLRPLLETTSADLRLTNDVEIVLSGLRDNVGVALISGTGSIVAGRNAAGEFVRVGGWGHIFGDEGSGYDIGCRALRAIAESVDGRGPETTITNLVFHDLKITEPYDLITKIYDKSMDKAAIARFAKFPLDQAYRSDPVSLQIVDAAARDLARMVTTAARRLGFTDQVPLAMTGGIMLHYLIVRDAMFAVLREEGTQVQPVLVIDPALSAARSLAGHWGIPT
jgi:N-acetylglucosamine kinase-like BadF-type ATPase